MRVRVPLLAAAILSAALAAPALAVVRASGLACSATGAASVSIAPATGALVLSNIGGSGQDGFSVPLVGFEGHSVSSTSVLGPDQVGMVCSFSWGVHNAGSAQQTPPRAGCITVTRTSVGVTLHLDLAQLSSSSSHRVLLYGGNGALLRESSSPSVSEIVVTKRQNAASVLMPSVSFELESKIVGLNGLPPGVPWTRRRAALAVRLGPGSTVNLTDGSLVDCDLVVFANEQCDATDDDCDSFEMRCASPVAGTSLEFSSMSCVRAGHTMSVADFNLDGLSDLITCSPSSGSSGGALQVTSSLFHRVFGDGGRQTPLQSLDTSGPLVRLHGTMGSVSSNPLYVDRSFHSSVLYQRSSPTVTNVMFSCDILPPTPSSASVVHFSSETSGAAPDSFRVIAGDVEVTRGVLPSSGDVVVDTPPGGVISAAVSSVGSLSTSWDLGTNKKVAPIEIAGGSSRRSTVGSPAPSLTLPSVSDVCYELAFSDERDFRISGLPVRGTLIQFKPGASSAIGGGFPITIAGMSFSSVRTSSGTASSGTPVFEVSDILPSGTDQVHASCPAGVALSSSRPSVDVAFDFDRAPSSTTAVRGYSVTFHMSLNLHLYNTVVTESDYLSSLGQTQRFITSNGGNSYTVDCALLGPGCGPTTGGRLFSIPVSPVPGAPDGIGFVFVDAVEIADCNAGPVTGAPGNRCVIDIDRAAPPAATAVTATQQKTGNDADGTTRIALQFSITDPEATAEVYRSSFGNFPLFSRGTSPGSVPSPPTSYPPPANWSRVSSTLSNGACTAAGCPLVDEPTSRDEFYYAVVMRDRAGNQSPFSNMTDGTLNYHLGDVAGGGGGGGGTLAGCPGDNVVNSADISRLGSVYGSTFSTTSPSICVDVAPTKNGTVDGRPMPDGRLNFKDLIINAINYSVVSLPRSAPSPTAASSNALAVRVPTIPGIGSTFDALVALDAAGDMQGLSAQLAWDPAVVEPVAVTEGELMAQQSRTGVVLSAGPGNIDAALLGVGGGISGSGTLARVTFRVKAVGDAAIRLASVEGRDARNLPVALGGVGALTPGRTAIRMAFPNPFDGNTTVVLALAQAGPVEVGVFDITGRQVRTLVRGTEPAGERILHWDGRDDRGGQLGAGVYMLRLRSGGHQETRALRLVR